MVNIVKIIQKNLLGDIIVILDWKILEAKNKRCNIYWSIAKWLEYKIRYFGIVDGRDPKYPPQSIHEYKDMV